MSLADVFNELGQETMPEIFADIFPDLMNITGETRTQGAGGGQVKSASPNAYTNVPVSYEPSNVESRVAAGDKSVSLNEYTLTFPTHHGGVRLNIDVKNHRLTVLARGNEPAKVFRIKAVRDLQGVVFEAICTKEN